MQFNKLYNLILESIISLSKESRIALLKKNGFNDNSILVVLKFLNRFDNKTGDFFCKYVANGELIKVDDPRIRKVELIIELNPSIDTQHYNGTMDLFIQLYKEKTLQLHAKRYSKTSEYIKQFPQFSEVKRFDNGVVIYKVELSKEGQKAVRKIVDLQWGDDANPWCLIARKSGNLDNAWNYWNNYNAYPKHIAFQNDKLLAFYANDKRGEPKWWDREDNYTTLLKLLDGSTMLVGILDWAKDEIANLFLKQLEFYIESGNLWKELNGKWSGKGTIEIKDLYLYEGRLPILFDRIDGDFVCSFSKLTTLEGSPVWVTGAYSCSQCLKIVSLKGAPEYVGKGFYCNHCNNLLSLYGAPKYVGSNFECEGNLKLTSTKGMPKEVGGDIIFDRCGCLMDLRYLPKNFEGNVSLEYCFNIPYLQRYKNKLWKDPLTGLWNSRGNINITNSDLINHRFPIKFGKINGDFKCTNLSSLYSLLNGPTEVAGNFNCGGCINLTSLEHSPKYVKETYYCNDTGITNLKGVTQNIGKNLECSYNEELTSLLGAPQKINGTFDCSHNHKLKNLIGAPREVKSLVCNSDLTLKSFLGAPTKIEEFIECYNCVELRNLKGLENTEVKHIYCYDCFRLDYTPEEEKKYGVTWEK